ncbi:NPL4-like protein 1 [Durio zibethinus]|uniref:NPL4-like protein 1 n=1 Tax=Durio zibethinus TaxID=66656 RepID=A0A6P5YN83_DURZI|nr:NPL4-like protein 1 [Durio zibethinus]
MDNQDSFSSGLLALNLSHGSIIFLYYHDERTVRGDPAVSPARSFGRKMTIDDFIAKQTRISRQESPHCSSVSFDRDSLYAFQRHVNETMAFAIKRDGFMYGTVLEEGRVEVDFIYEPPQQGSEDDLIFLRDPVEENAIAGMKRAAELHAESGLKERVTVVEKLEANEDGAADVHFEAFQISVMCVKLFKEGWFVTELGEDDDPKLSKMKKDGVVGVITGIVLLLNLLVIIIYTIKLYDESRQKPEVFNDADEDDCRVYFKCKRQYHRLCMDQWLAKETHCPLCHPRFKAADNRPFSIIVYQ